MLIGSRYGSIAFFFVLKPQLNSQTATGPEISQVQAFLLHFAILVSEKSYQKTECKVKRRGGVHHLPVFKQGSTC